MYHLALRRSLSLPFTFPVRLKPEKSKLSKIHHQNKNSTTQLPKLTQEYPNENDEGERNGLPSVSS